MPVESIGTPGLWIGFAALIVVVLAVDLGLFQRTGREVRFKEALGWTLTWISLALAFNVFIYLRFGTERALEFLTGYLIEEALSVDNLFVFLVLFGYFAVPRAYQRRVLIWGILGAVVMRISFILVGAALLQRFHFLIYVFGAFLIYTGVKLFTSSGGEVHPERNPVVRLVKRFVPMVGDYRGGRFLVKEGGRWLATPLLLALLVVEATDVVFALDSIPAIFAVTTDTFIVFTSNIFAVLGLRSLYFVLSGVMGKFRYLKYGLALVLIFVGTKMVLSDVYKLHVVFSLGIVALILTGSVLLSVLRPAPPEELIIPPQPRSPEEPDSLKAEGKR